MTFPSDIFNLFVVVNNHITLRAKCTRHRHTI